MDVLRFRASIDLSICDICQHFRELIVAVVLTLQILENRADTIELALGNSYPLINGICISDRCRRISEGHECLRLADQILIGCKKITCAGLPALEYGCQNITRSCCNITHIEVTALGRDFTILRTGFCSDYAGSLPFDSDDGDGGGDIKEDRNDDNDI